MAAHTIAEELLSEINSKPYVEKVAPLSLDDKLSDNVFQTLKRATSNKYVYSYDRFCTKKGVDKPAGVFEIFGEYSGKSASEIRRDMIQYVTDNKRYISELAEGYFAAKRQHVDMWLAIMIREKNAGDELALFILCKLHNRHAVIYNRSTAWSTLNLKSTRPLEQLCDIVLVYRNNGFCEAIKKDSTEVATPSIPKKQKRKTVSITEVLTDANDREDTAFVNKVSAQLSTSNILPEGPRIRNIRDHVPLRRRSSTRSQCETQKNRNYSENIDNNHLELPKRKKKKMNVPSTLREPSQTLQIAQQHMTRSKLQLSAPAGKIRKIIGTMVKDEDDKKPKLETEAELNKHEKQRTEALHRAYNKKKPWPVNAKLVHIDGTDCSPTCMKDPNSKYHSDNIPELQDATPTSSLNHVNREILDPRSHRIIGMPTTLPANETQNNNNRLEVATEEAEKTRTENRNTVNEHESLEELNGATTTPEVNADTKPTVKPANTTSDNDDLHGPNSPETAEKTTTIRDQTMELDDATQDPETDDRSSQSEASGAEMLQVNQPSKQYDIRKQANKLPEQEDSATDDAPTTCLKTLTLSED